MYATSWTQPKQGVPTEFLLISDEDTQGLMEVFARLSSSKLDLILHSPGGSAEATEAMVSFIRSKYNDVRIFVPHAAMSAATMLACSGNKIIMGNHSFLGPIDPQVLIQTQLGPQSVAVQAVLDQFEQAKRECQDPKLFPAWLPLLPQYGPALLTQCRESLKLSKELATKWLAEYMFKGQKDARTKAGAAAAWLANHQLFKTHGRHINRDQARVYLAIDDLEKDKKLEDLVMSVFHATTLTFSSTIAVKIIENHLGNAFVKQFGLLIAAPRPPQSAPPGSSPFFPIPPELQPPASG
jgi:hypothetical protein